MARAGDADPVLLAVEAAHALAGLAHDPRALVVSGRRLIEFHPLCGPLWCVTAQVLAAEDPCAAAERAVEELELDPTAEELACSFRSGSVVVAAPSPPILEALRLRPDLEIRLVGDASALRWAVRALAEAGDVSGWLLDESESSLEDADVAVIEVAAAGPQGCVVAPGARMLAAQAGRAGVPLWAVAGVGRILPGPLFAALSARSDEAQLVPVDEIAAVIGRDGLEAPTDALARSGCLALRELMH